MTKPAELGARLATAEELAAWIADEDIRSSVRRAHVVAGDIAIEGELSLYDGDVLVVTGSVDVTGDVLTDETATLVVRGDLRAQHLYLEGNLEIHGDATLRGVVYGFYEAGISRVYGTTCARLGLIGDHDWACDREAFEVTLRFANNSRVRSGDPSAVRALLGEAGFAEIAKMIGASDRASPTRNGAWGLRAFVALDG